MVSSDRPRRPLPPGFGAVRHHTKDISLGVVYEHHYAPAAVRPLEQGELVEGTLRPAVCRGKVGFLFVGSKNSNTADHARCWLGHILLQELQKGSLSEVEYIAAELAPVPPQWMWHVWPPSDGETAEGGGAAFVEVCMAVGPVGIALTLSGPEAPRAHVQRVLYQYCTQEATWTPIPSAPHTGHLDKVHRTREIPAELAKQRLRGVPAPEAPSKLLTRSLEEYREVEKQVQGAVNQLEDNWHQPLQLLTALDEVREAFGHWAELNRRIKHTWEDAVSYASAILLRHLLEEADADRMREAVRLVQELQRLGVRAPEHLELAEELCAAKGLARHSVRNWTASEEEGLAGHVSRDSVRKWTAEESLAGALVRDSVGKWAAPDDGHVAVARDSVRKWTESPKPAGAMGGSDAAGP